MDTIICTAAVALPIGFGMGWFFAAIFSINKGAHDEQDKQG